MWAAYLSRLFWHKLSSKIYDFQMRRVKILRFAKQNEIIAVCKKYVRKFHNCFEAVIKYLIKTNKLSNELQASGTSQSSQYRAILYIPLFSTATQLRIVVCHTFLTSPLMYSLVLFCYFEHPIRGAAHTPLLAFTVNAICYALICTSTHTHIHTILEIHQN